MGAHLKTSDICQVSGYSRDQVQSLLKLLPPYCVAPAEQRIARVFRPQDLIVISAAYQLECHCGVRRAELGNIGLMLHATLNGPKVVSADPLLVVSFDPPVVKYVATRRAQVEVSVVRLRPIFDRVDAYLERAANKFGEQWSLDLYPALATDVLRAPGIGRNSA